MEHDLTRGNVLKTIAVFALPYMLSYFLQMLYGMADLYMMGQFSGAAGITVMVLPMAVSARSKRREPTAWPTMTVVPMARPTVGFSLHW